MATIDSAAGAAKLASFCIIIGIANACIIKVNGTVVVIAAATVVGMAIGALGGVRRGDMGIVQAKVVAGVTMANPVGLMTTITATGSKAFFVQVTIYTIVTILMT